MRQDEVAQMQRKRFTRAEMARVVKERNYYKMELYNLREAVRWAEHVKAERRPTPQPIPKRRSRGFFTDLCAH